MSTISPPSATKAPPRRRFVLIDRDGTLIEERHYLADPDGVTLIAGAGPALARLAAAGFGLVVLTNQSGVARGYFTLEAVEAVHRRLETLLAAEGVALDGIFVCPHGPDDGCDCRKPLPGLARAAADRFGFDLTSAVVVGDKLADIELARSIGAVGLLVKTGHGAEHATRAAGLADAVLTDLPAAAAWILAATARNGGV